MMVLDEAVVGIARKGQRIEPQRVDRPASERGEPWPRCHQMRQVETDDVGGDREVGVAGENLQRSSASSSLPCRKAIVPSPSLRTAAKANIFAVRGSTSRSTEDQRENRLRADVSMDYIHGWITDLLSFGLRIGFVIAIWC